MRPLLFSESLDLADIRNTSAVEHIRPELIKGAGENINQDRKMTSILMPPVL